MMLALSLLACLVGLSAPEQQPRIESKKGGTQVVVSVTIPKTAAAKLPQGAVSRAAGEKWLRFVLVRKDKVGPPMFGSYKRKGTTLSFQPSVKLERGFRYRAIYTPEKNKSTQIDYVVPLNKKVASTKVLEVYPTAKVLPANHLRFHIRFSGPMRGGKEIFTQMQILDEKGKAVRDPWLTDELWDQADRKLILYIHPGRIKWEVLMRKLLGPVLVPNRKYTLVIRKAIKDADGNPLVKEYRKSFKTVAENRTRIDLSQWKAMAPKANTQEPVVVTFPAAMDYSSLHRFLHIVDSKDQKVTGKITIGKHERSWKFSPTKKWDAEEYRLVVDPRFEDTAGNTPMAPFDRDLKKPLPQPQQLQIPFQVR